jgi:hypothetical protein
VATSSLRRSNYIISSISFIDNHHHYYYRQSSDCIYINIMRKGLKNQLKKFKGELRRSPSPNPPNIPTDTGSQVPSDPTLAPLAGTTGGIEALVAQGPSPNLRPTILPLQSEPANTVTPGTKSLAPSGDSGSASAMGIPAPTISVQSPSDVYADLISPSDVGDKPNVASIGFQGFKTALTMIREAAGAFPPLKSVTGGLLALIDIVEVREFDHLYRHLQRCAYRRCTRIKKIVPS